MRVLWSLLMLLSVVQPVFAWSRCALVAVRPNDVLVANNHMDPGEAEFVARNYGMVATGLMPDELAPIKAINPNIISVYQWTSGGFWKQDWDHGFRMEHWQVADTTFNIVYKMMWWYQQNKDHGVDWLYRHQDGTLVEYWACNMLNWSDSCPLGVWGETKGLKASEAAAKAVLECSADTTFRKYWDWWWFDTYPGGWRDPATWHDVVGFSLPQEQRNEDEFLETLRLGLLQKQFIILGQDQLHTANAYMINGWKLEDWLWQSGSSHRWIDWWTGQRNTTGYYEAEMVLHRYNPRLPQYDKMQGWDASVVEAMRHGMNDATWAKYARYALATSMLGDGWYACESLTSATATRIPEMTSWQFDLPALTDVYSIKNPQRVGAFLICRQYRASKTAPPTTAGKVCTVVVDTVAADGYVRVGQLQ